MKKIEKLALATALKARVLEYEGRLSQVDELKQRWYREIIEDKLQQIARLEAPRKQHTFG